MCCDPDATDSASDEDESSSDEDDPDFVITAVKVIWLTHSTMAKFLSYTFLYLLISNLSLFHYCAFADDSKEYIVYMGALPKSDYSPLAHHQSILEQVLENRLPSDSLVHSYKRSFNGFAVKLTDRERKNLDSIEGIVSVFPSRTLSFHTTRSWDFMGFTENVERVPTVKSEDSARDLGGNGTHTTSTAVGNLVQNVSFYGLAQGNARGAVPSARIAVYKACVRACKEANVLAAFDDAISDGVDILSISLRSKITLEYFIQPIAIGSFHAMQKCILTINSVGNWGSSINWKQCSMDANCGS
ncbi:hypothetical protein IFM89_025715 [Coptis chinensis]|uniref:Cucumisin n=1 Tax=Coptis chinensis TaxID=261450 RepID=A0A835HHC0_9MAGN|nr:hypothetical protein IFM89_025715 [Coptis chinensis]